MGKEGRLDLLQALECGAGANTLVLGQGNGLDLACLRVLDLGGDGRNLIVEPACLLRNLGSPVRLSSVLVLALARDVEVLSDVFRGLAHGLHAVLRLLVLEHLIDERPFEPVAACCHALSTHGETDLDAADGDLVGNVLYGLESRGAEAVQRRAGCGVGETSGEHGGADIVGSFGI